MYIRREMRGFKTSFINIITISSKKAQMTRQTTVLFLRFIQHRGDLALIIITRCIELNANDWLQCEILGSLPCHSLPLFFTIGMAELHLARLCHTHDHHCSCCIDSASYHTSFRSKVQYKSICICSLPRKMSNVPVPFSRTSRVLYLPTVRSHHVCRSLQLHTLACDLPSLYIENSSIWTEWDNSVTDNFLFLISPAHYLRAQVHNLNSLHSSPWSSSCTNILEFVFGDSREALIGKPAVC